MRDPGGATRGRRPAAGAVASADAATRRRGALGGAVLAVLIVACLVVIGSRGEEPVEPAPAGAATPSDEESLGTELLTPEVPEQPPPTPPTAATAREPTPADAAAYTDGRHPGDGGEVESVSVDLDGDGRPEVVAVVQDAGAVQVEVAVWDGDAYDVAFTDRLSPVEDVTRFEVSDVTGDGRREVVLAVRDDGGERVALWGLGEDGMARQVASGGCWDGSHVYGTDGAEVADGTLTAACDPPLASGAEAVYTWDGELWSYEGGAGR